MTDHEIDKKVIAAWSEIANTAGRADLHVERPALKSLLDAVDREISALTDRVDSLISDVLTFRQQVEELTPLTRIVMRAPGIWYCHSHKCVTSTDETRCHQSIWRTPQPDDRCDIRSLAYQLDPVSEIDANHNSEMLS